jgi:hypothetical protein
MRNGCVYGKPNRRSVSLSMIASTLNLPIHSDERPFGFTRVKFAEEAKQPDPFESGCL